MQPESQALIREFNRRLRSALTAAPNHVRVEAALEVESHIYDVLASQTLELSETEAVAQILAGFGSPEAYAAALLSQMPGEAVTVRSGLKEVGQATVDLGRGTGRLVRAGFRASFTLADRILRLIWAGMSWGADKGQAAAEAVIGATRRWLEHSREPARRLRDRARLRLERVGHGLLQVAEWAWHQAGRLWALAGTTRAGARWLTVQLRLAGGVSLRLVRWLLRTAGLLALGGLVLLALAIAGFSALAPDLSGWFVLQARNELFTALDELRSFTIHSIQVGTGLELAQTGTIVLVTALALAAIFGGLFGYLVWHNRQRRKAAAGL